MLTKKPSDNMKKMYEAKRKETSQKIIAAIKELQSDGGVVTRKKIIDMTGVSSGTLSQEYIKDIFREYQVLQFAKEVSTSKKDTNRDASIDSLSAEIGALKSKLQDYEQALELKQKQLDKALAELSESKNSYQLLSGKYQQLLEYIDSVGGDLKFLHLI